MGKALPAPLRMPRRQQLRIKKGAALSTRGVHAGIWPLPRRELFLFQLKVRVLDWELPTTSPLLTTERSLEQEKQSTGSG